MTWQEHLLRRAAALVRLPSAPDRVPEVGSGGSGLECPVTGTEFLYHDGILDLLPNDGPKTLSHRSLAPASPARPAGDRTDQRPGRGPHRQHVRRESSASASPPARAAQGEARAALRSAALAR